MISIDIGWVLLGVASILLITGYKLAIFPKKCCRKCGCANG